MDRLILFACVMIHMVLAKNSNDFCIPVVSMLNRNDDLSVDKKDCVTKEQMTGLLAKRTCDCQSNDNNCTIKSEIDELKRNISAVMEQIKRKPEDCEDIQRENYSQTGEYTIYPYQRTRGIAVRCDMDTSTGGWTVIQKRTSESDFYKNWHSYEFGFGNLSTNFWLGLHQIHMITRQDRYELRIDLLYSDSQTAYAEYGEFSIGNAESGYKLYVNEYSGTAGDSLTSRGNGMKFSTHDRDNDIYGDGNCAILYHGGWWYDKCHTSNLNGDYGNTAYAKGPVWEPWKGYYAPMKATEMKIRRIV